MKRNIISTIFGISSFLIVACSSDSGSEMNSANPTYPSTSTCALANKYLPAYPAIAYEDAFGGGCQATVQIPIAQATEYSNLLVTNGFERIPLTSESNSYKKNISMDSALSMTIVYSAGTLVASVQEIAREYEFGDLSLIAENFLEENFCTTSWQTTADYNGIFCSVHKEIDDLLLMDKGWKNAKDSRFGVAIGSAYFIKYNEKFFKFYEGDGEFNMVVYIEYEPNPSYEVQSLFK